MPEAKNILAIQPMRIPQHNGLKKKKKKTEGEEDYTASTWWKTGRKLWWSCTNHCSHLFVIHCSKTAKTGKTEATPQIKVTHASNVVSSMKKLKNHVCLWWV